MGEPAQKRLSMKLEDGKTLRYKCCESYESSGELEWQVNKGLEVGFEVRNVL